MSFIYLKSSRYLKNNDGSSILQNNSELPYQFVNSFREPIKVNPNSKIEIVSADLNVEPLHQISDENDNNSFVYGFGSQSNQFLQKLIKIPNGTYSNDELASKIQKLVSETNLLDSSDIWVSYSKTKGFEVVFNLFSDQLNGSEKDDNKYFKLNSKMGFQESDGALNAGIGNNGLEEITIYNRNNLANPNTLTKNSVLRTFEVGGSTLNNDNKPSKLISNMITPSRRGINNSAGTISTIFQPIKHLVFADGWETPTNGVVFATKIAGVTTGAITIASEGGGHNLSFKFTAGATTYHCKFVLTKAQFDSYTLPSSLTHDNIPWGHLLIINTSNQAVNTTLASNYCTLMLDTNDYKWKLFNAGTSGLSEFDFFASVNPEFVKTTATITNLGNRGTGCLALSRGECCIVGDNQVNNTNRFTRARVYNDTNSTDVYSDYSVVISPTTDGTDNYVQMNYGTQVTDKVGGDTDWLTLTNEPKTDDNKLSALLPNLTDNDNICITASMNSWYCVDFWLTHDNAGNCDFKNDILLGTTESDKEGVHLPMNFTEASFPIMPIIGVNNGYIKNEQQTLSFGQYSENDVDKHSTAKLNEYMNTNWNSDQTIPVRQEKATYSNYCRAWQLETRVSKLEPNGFSGVNTEIDFEVIEGQPISTIESPPIVLKLGYPLNSDDDKRLTAQNLSNTPPSGSLENTLISRLNLHMGFPNLILIESEDSGTPDGPADHTFETENQILYNESQNYIVNFTNLGKIHGQNSATGSVSNIVGVIPGAELIEVSANTKHYQASYPQPVKINAKTEELINNFEVSITNDNGTPATGLRHPINICCRLTEN